MVLMDGQCPVLEFLAVRLRPALDDHTGILLWHLKLLLPKHLLFFASSLGSWTLTGTHSHVAN